jgi:eukaryotic-like serine/threonine-protein kinase
MAPTAPDEGPLRERSAQEPSGSTVPVGPSPVSPARGRTEGPLERGAHVGRYVILKLVGRGGMGVVYAAYDPELDRKIALKLLRPDGHDADANAGRARLLREARAMAKVNHPNACAVFDVGTWGDQVFVAMEFIEGPTLEQWLGEPRSWGEVLGVFLQAGQGLAAAHEVGLVHRDFKPANVLIGKGGRAFVTDFGLARHMSATGEDPGHVSFPSARQGASAPPASAETASVTQEGLVMGTPLYMPPEQYLGSVPDARSDQFSFCTALYSALYGRRPFDPQRVRDALTELSQSLERAEQTPGVLLASAPRLVGTIQEPPRDAKVPAWLRRAVMRGLALEPAQRFASMQALLEELSEGPRRVRRRRALLAASVLGLVVLAPAWVQWRRQSQVCAGAEQFVAEAWSPPLRQKLEESFAASGKPFAADAMRHVVEVLDEYAQAWAAQHTEACEATRLRGGQTEELLSLRVVCLERRRKSLRALARLLAEADGKAVERAVDAVHTLPALEECRDIESLSNQSARPAAPDRRAAVESLEAELAEAAALREAGRYKPALELVKGMEPRAVAAGWLPLQAEVDSLMGVLQRDLGNPSEGARYFEQAANEALAGRAERTLVVALNRLVHLHSAQNEWEQAERWARLARSALARLGGEALLASEVEGNLGNMAMVRGRYPEARSHFERLHELQRQALAPDDPRLAKTLYSQGLVALRLGDNRRALVLLLEALRITEAAKGPRHPEAASRHSMLSLVQRELGDFSRGLDHARRAVDIREATLGAQHPLTADALDAVGMSLIGLGRHEEALQVFQETLAIKQQALGRQHSNLSYSYDGIGQALLAAGRAAEAVGPLERALAFEDVDPDALAETGFTLAQALWRTGGDRARAVRVATQARDRFARVGKQPRVAAVEAWLKEHPLR